MWTSWEWTKKTHANCAVISRSICSIIWKFVKHLSAIDPDLLHVEKRKYAQLIFQLFSSKDYAAYGNGEHLEHFNSELKQIRANNEGKEWKKEIENGRNDGDEPQYKENRLARTQSLTGKQKWTQHKLIDMYHDLNFVCVVCSDFPLLIHKPHRVPVLTLHGHTHLS